MAIKTYEDGLNDAWSAVKKIVCEVEDGGYDTDELHELFELGYADEIILRYTPQEAIDRILAYEKKKVEKIKVGSEITFLKYTGNKFEIVRGIVFAVNAANTIIKLTVYDFDDKRLYEIPQISGRNVTPTGRFFPSVQMMIDEVVGHD